MALDPARLSTGLKAAIETAFGLVGNPDYVPAELKKFTDAVANEVVKEADDNAELDLAALFDVAVTGTTPSGGAVTAQVVDASVTGGIK